MMRRETVAAVALSATMFTGLCTIGHGQTNPAAPIPAAGLPQAMPAFPAPSDPTNVLSPVAPTLPGIDPNAAPPAFPSAVPSAAVLPGNNSAVPNPFPSQPPAGPFSGSVDNAAPTPPPLGSMEYESTDIPADGATGTVANASAPSQLYTFLFVEDEDYGVIRQKFQSGVADDLKEQEINRLADARRQGQTPGGGANIPGVTPGYSPDLNGGFGGDPLAGIGGGAVTGIDGSIDTGNESAVRAAAEWDFYYDQLEMYDRYVREKLIPDEDEDQLPELTYDSTNILQERQDLFEAFQEASIQQSNQDSNKNKEFYERLQKREDRRRAYMDWLLLKQREVNDWAEVWARKVYGQRWADGEQVRVDDWYYGTDFNSAEPVIIQIDDREYVVSRQPVNRLENGQLNVISSNLTPYDIVDNNGYLKNPVMETLRGSIIIPPAPPVYTTPDPTAGTIEIIGGDY